ncbi:MAG TPA: phosphoribosylamine--glycine ligase [Roseiflexaceae bacterium]|nr:phosphoribosylamine--glycine ligase [Roseiflexaceae bacterium]
MNVLLVGSGGREHALAWKLAQSPLLTELLIAPGNPGTALHGRTIPVGVDAIPQLVELARRERVGLVVVGPEAPLAQGLADACAEAGIPVFGPRAAAARIESSKAFAKELMLRAGVPTAEARIFDSAEEAAAFARASGRVWVIKADGLASGKGVIVPDSPEETVAAIGQIGAMGLGGRLLLEERLSGPEVSVIALCDGERLLPLPPARDHKRLRDGDQGPNTGGMGAVAPAEIGADTYNQIVDTLMLPVVGALREAGTPFCGALYAGVMLTEQGPRILEFNARFGDPETQAILPLLRGDLLAALLACAEGGLQPAMLSWGEGAAACVVLAAHGYPEAPRRGDPISGVEAVEHPDTLVFHAGTALEEGRLVTSGGRVLGITGLGADLDTALARVYAAADTVTFDGVQLRRDIGRTA